MKKKENLFKFIIFPIVFGAFVVIYASILCKESVESHEAIHYYKDSFSEEESRAIKIDLNVEPDCDYEITRVILTTESFTAEFDCSDELENVLANMFALHNLSNKETVFRTNVIYESVAGDVVEAMRFNVYEYKEDGPMDVYIWTNDDNYYQVAVRNRVKSHPQEIWEMFKE